MTDRSEAAIDEAAGLSPAAARRRARQGTLTGPTAGVSLGYQQANLVAVPEVLADDFAGFCEANPAPCPLLERTAPGDPRSRNVAEDADLRTDVPRYRILADGVFVDGPGDATAAWRPDTVAFLLGCSLSFEGALLDAGVPLRHLEARRRLPMYETSRACEPSGPFRGALMVSMRPVPSGLVDVVERVTAPRWWSHGGPVHVGDPAQLGIADLQAPAFGDPPVLEPGDVAVFWACGVTPQTVARAARPPYLIAHWPGQMLITDLPADVDPRPQATPETKGGSDCSPMS